VWIVLSTRLVKFVPVSGNNRTAGNAVTPSRNFTDRSGNTDTLMVRPSGEGDSTVSVQLPVVVGDATDDSIVIWHVDAGPDTGLSRLAGAWVLKADDTVTLANLVPGRRILATDRGRAALTAAHIALGGLVDPSEVVAAVADVRDELQQLYVQARATTGGKHWTAPAWPHLPAAVDVEHPPSLVAEPVVQRALGIASWLTSVCEAWVSIERQRLAHKYMIDAGGPAQRPMPLGAAS
jgi:hypothetical protein